MWVIVSDRGNLAESGVPTQPGSSWRHALHAPRATTPAPSTFLNRLRISPVPPLLQNLYETFVVVFFLLFFSLSLSFLFLFRFFSPRRRSFFFSLLKIWTRSARTFRWLPPRLLLALSCRFFEYFKAFLWRAVYTMYDFYFDFKTWPQRSGTERRGIRPPNFFAWQS